MIKNYFAAAIALGALTTSAHAVVSSMDDLLFTVGNGANHAALVIDFNDGTTTESFAWGYRWDGVASGADMFLAIVAADSNLSASTFASSAFPD